MSDTTEAPRIVQPGERITAVYDGLTIGTTAHGLGGAGLTLSRGQSFIATAEILEAGKNRYGEHTWARLVHDPDAQLSTWGRVMLVPGDASDDLRIPEYGTPAWEEAREIARKAAWAIPDPEQRARARAEVEATYGPAPQTSQTVSISDPEERARARAEERAKHWGGPQR